MKNSFIIMLVTLAAVCLVSCESESDRAAKLMAEIRADYEAGRYEAVLSGIDTLRANFPTAVEERREAIGLYQEASLRLAQDNLARIDRELQAAERSCDSLGNIVAEHRVALCATAEELHRLNVMKVRRDSLKGQFDVECAKIKYIHRRQKE